MHTLASSIRSHKISTHLQMEASMRIKITLGGLDTKDLSTVDFLKFPTVVTTNAGNCNTDRALRAAGKCNHCGETYPQQN